MRWSRRSGRRCVPDGFVLIDKPGGWTSHDVVARCRRLFGTKRIGHAGTLDPMATGLLVLAVGRVTRLIRFVADTAKVYEATAQFGVATDTLDADGAILGRDEMEFGEDDVRRAAERFVGVIPQVPPMVSAVKVDGRRLYQLAREGIEVERAARPVTVHAIEVLEVAPGRYPEVTLRVVCGPGTYVRVLADDIARALGGRAHLTALRRTAIGAHTVDQAFTLERLAEMADAGTVADALIDPDSALRHLPGVVVDDTVADAVRHGTVFAAPAFLPETGLHRVIAGDGTLLAVYRSDGRRAKPEVVVG